MAKKFPDWDYVDDNNVPDANNKLKIVYTVYDRQGNELQYTRDQQIAIGNDGKYDENTTWGYIMNNLVTTSNQVLQGILSVDASDAAIAARQKEAAEAATKASAESTAAAQSADTSTTTTTTTGSTANYGSVQ